MESNWAWNGWWAGGNIGPWGLVAHLREPVAGLNWIAQWSNGNVGAASLIVLDAEGYCVNFFNGPVPPGEHFPFGFDVDQTRLG